MKTINDMTYYIEVKELKESAIEDLKETNEKLSNIDWVKALKDDIEFQEALRLKFTADYIIEKFNLEKSI